MRCELCISSLYIFLDVFFSCSDDKRRIWHSGPIVKRHSPRLVATRSGSTYYLEGPLNRAGVEKLGIGELFVQFQDGFPENWLTIIQDYLLQTCMHRYSMYHVLQHIHTYMYLHPLVCRLDDVMFTCSKTISEANGRSTDGVRRGEEKSGLDKGEGEREGTEKEHLDKGEVEREGTGGRVHRRPEKEHLDKGEGGREETGDGLHRRQEKKDKGEEEREKERRECSEVENGWETSRRQPVAE